MRIRITPHPIWTIADKYTRVSHTSASAILWRCDVPMALHLQVRPCA